MVAPMLIWSQNLFFKLQISRIIPKNATVVYINNKKAIKLAENSIFQK